MANKSMIYTAKTMAELYTLMRNITDITPVAGTTGLPYDGHTDRVQLPQSILYLKRIAELEEIVKRERFIDFGAATPLNAILNLGDKNIPPILYQALRFTANAAIRNCATLGGNIAQADIRHSCLLPLLALDAKIEVRTVKETLWTSLMQYCSNSAVPLRNASHVILRIRLPLEQWDISYYKRLGHVGYIAEDTASFIFLGRTQKNILSSAKLLFAGTVLIKNKAFDNLLIGRTLPIDRRSVDPLMKETHRIFDGCAFISDFQRACFFNLIEQNIYSLT